MHGGLRCCGPRWSPGACPPFSSDLQPVLACCMGHPIDAAPAAAAAACLQDSEPVTALALSPDGRLLFAASRSLQLRCWSVESGQVLRSYRGHKAPVADMALDASGGLLATASADRSVRVWDVDGGFCTHSFTGHRCAAVATGELAPWAGRGRLLDGWRVRWGEGSGCFPSKHLSCSSWRAVSWSTRRPAPHAWLHTYAKAWSLRSPSCPWSGARVIAMRQRPPARCCARSAVLHALRCTRTAVLCYACAAVHAVLCYARGGGCPQVPGRQAHLRSGLSRRGVHFPSSFCLPSPHISVPTASPI